MQFADAAVGAAAVAAARFLLLLRDPYQQLLRTAGENGVRKAAVAAATVRASCNFPIYLYTSLSVSLTTVAAAVHSSAAVAAASEIVL